MANTSCTITKAGRFDEYGRALVPGQVYTGTVEFIEGLYNSGYCTPSDFSAFDDGSKPYMQLSASAAAAVQALVAYPQTFQPAPTFPDEIYTFTGSQTIYGGPCKVVGLRAVSVTAGPLSLSLYDTPYSATGVVLDGPRSLNTGDEVVFASPILAFNGVHAAFTGTANFELIIRSIEQ